MLPDKEARVRVKVRLKCF